MADKTYTYTNAPTATNRDGVRFLVGDTDLDDPFLTDGEIDFLLTQYPSATLAASYAAESIAAILIRDSGTRFKDIELGRNADSYIALATTLRSRSARSASPYAGGLSISEKEDARDDTDLVQPSFTRQTFVPRAGGLVGSTNTNSMQDQAE